MIAPMALAIAYGLPIVLAQSGTFPAGVAATGTMGPTNPTAAVANTPINQSSDARLLTINSIDDFCLFAPPTFANISDSETEEVAWCTKPRNNARVIPDGVLQSASFLKTEFYVQIMGTGDFTQMNIPSGDEGGELDPHGAEGSGNPIGGNVTTNITGSELNVAEWMQYISYSEFCIRACTNANSSYSAAQMCWHELDEMGCRFVMPGNYDFQGFQSCDADVAYPPGWYPETAADGQVAFSTFAQYYTGIYTSNGIPVSYTVGTTVTPTTAAFTPSSSNCVTVPTIANGVLSVSGTGTPTSASSSGPGSGSGSSTTPTGSSSAPGTTTASSSLPPGSTPTGKAPGTTPTSHTTTTTAAGQTQPANGAAGTSALLGLMLASAVTVAAGAVMAL